MLDAGQLVEICSCEVRLLQDLEQLLSKCQVVGVLVLFDFNEVLRGDFHHYKRNESFGWQLTNLEIRFHLLNLVFNTEVGAPFEVFDLALQIVLPSSFRSLHIRTVDGELTLSFDIESRITFHLGRILTEVVG